MATKFIPTPDMELMSDHVVLNRVSKTVKGGRVARFAAIVVCGDGNGHIGYGSGKAAEVPEAIRKATEDAKRNMITVSLKDATIPHEIIGKYGAGSVLLKPAAEGTGIIAGGATRRIMEMAGIRNIRCKCLGTNNAINVVKATFAGLAALRTAEEVAKMRGIEHN